MMQDKATEPKLIHFSGLATELKMNQESEIKRGVAADHNVNVYFLRVLLSTPVWLVIQIQTWASFVTHRLVWLTVLAR